MSTEFPALPTTESPADILHDQVNLIATSTISGVAYGVVLALYLTCVHFLYINMGRDNRRRSIFFIAYATAMFSLGTLYVAANARTVQLAYVDHRDFPGGPAFYTLVIYAEPISIFGNVTFILTNWLADALLIWRFWVIYNRTSYRNFIVILPALLFTASIVTGIFLLSGATNAVVAGIPFNFGLAYFSISVTQTITTTLLMLARLILYKRALAATVGSDHARMYTTISAMLIESAALYAVFSIIFIGLFSVDHPVQWVFLASLAEVQMVAPLLIIFRVARGKAWDTSTSSTIRSLSTIQIAPGQSKTTMNSSTIGTGQRVHVSTPLRFTGAESNTDDLPLEEYKAASAGDVSRV